MNRRSLLFSLAPTLAFVLAGCSSAGRSIDAVPAELGEPPSRAQDYRIVTLLPRDAIPAIDHPVFLTAAEADAEYERDEQVLGVVFNGQARAYSTSLLSGHEIVNDEVGGVKIAVTW